MCYTSSVLRKSRHMKTKRKNYALLLGSKLKITKIEHNYNLSTNTATTLFNEPDHNGHSALLIDNKYSPRLAWFLSQTITWLTTDHNVQRKKSSMPTQVSSGGNVKRSNSVTNNLHYSCGTINYSVFPC